MQKIKGLLENVIFSLNNQVKSPIEEEDLKQKLLVIKEILKDFTLEELEEKARILQEEKLIYEEKFMKSLENINILEEKLVSMENPNLQTSDSIENQSFIYKSPLKRKSNNIWGSHHINIQEIKETYDFEAENLEKENSNLLKLTREKSEKISQLESNIKDFKSNNKEIFSTNCDLHKEITEIDLKKKRLFDLEKDFLRKIETNKLKMLFYENKTHLLETINKEILRNQAFLVEETEKIRNGKDEIKAFYEEKINEIEIGLLRKKPENLSFFSEGISNNNNNLGNNLKAEDFVDFKNSVIKNLENTETLSTFSKQKSSLIKENERKSLISKEKKHRKSIRNHRRNKSDIPMPKYQENDQNDRLLTIRSMSEISDCQIENEAKNLENEEEDNLSFQYERIKNRISSLKAKKGLLFEKNEEKTELFIKNKGKLSCEPFCLIF